jgi:nitrate reductase alpha subunit
MNLSRRDFIRLAGTSGLGLFASQYGFLGLANLIPVDVGNPLDQYPSRDWEKVYRDQYRYDRSFSYVCAPNDTHNCRMRAYVRNGVVLRTEQNHDSDRVGDLLGNKATAHWNPRGCLKGFTLHRRIYGPYRLKHPMIRKGWRAWADDGFPSLSDDPALRTKYKFDSRGLDSFDRMSWEQIFDYQARAVVAIAKTYSGKDG